MVVWQYHTSTSAVFPNISTLANVILILRRNFKLNELKDTVLSVFAQFYVMKIVSNKATAKLFCALLYWMNACFERIVWGNDSMTQSLRQVTYCHLLVVLVFILKVLFYFYCVLTRCNAMLQYAIKGIFSMLIWVFVVTWQRILF